MDSEIIRAAMCETIAEPLRKILGTTRPEAQEARQLYDFFIELYYTKFGDVPIGKKTVGVACFRNMMKWCGGAEHAEIVLRWTFDNWDMLTRDHGFYEITPKILGSATQLHKILVLYAKDRR